jgi:hypothetical protein
VYFLVDGVKYWIMPGPSGFLVYGKESSRTRYLGRRSVAEIKEMLAKAGAETLQRIKSDIETLKLALESQKTAAQTAQTTQTLTWKKEGHTYWLLQYSRTFYVYMKGPSTKHKPRLIEKSDINGVVGRVVAAGALHVLEALRLLINGLHAAVADLLRPQRSAAGEAQVPRREAEDAFRELRRELSRAVKRWDEEWRMKARDWGGPDREWLKERLSEFIDDYVHLIEKILPHPDLKDKFADAVEEATAGYLTKSDALEILE